MENVQKKGKKKVRFSEDGDEETQLGKRPKQGEKLMQSAIKSHKKNPPNID